MTGLHGESGPSEREQDVGVPPMVVPAEVAAEPVAIRHGNKFILGYEANAGRDSAYFIAPRGMGGMRKATRYPLDESGWAEAWQDFAGREPGHATDYMRQFAGPRPRRVPAPPVPLLTLPSFPGREVEAVLDLVTVWSVVSRNAISDFGSEVAGVFGGNVGGIEKVIGSAVAETKRNMYEEVRRLQGDAVIGVTLDLQTVEKAQAVMLTGTVVRLRAED